MHVGEVVSCHRPRLFPRTLAFLPLLTAICSLVFHGEVSAQGGRNPFVVNIALEAPNYADSGEVGSHAVYSLIMAQILTNTFNQSHQRDCPAAGSIAFPDLQILLEVAGTRASAQAKACVTDLSESLKSLRPDRPNYERAVQELLKIHRPVSLETGNLARRDLVFTRLRLLGTQVLKQLYADDPALGPLLNIDNQLEQLSRDYDGFASWFEVQQRAGSFGIYSTFVQAPRLLAEWNFPSVQIASRPIPQAVHLNQDGRLQVRAASVGGRSLLVIRCWIEVAIGCVQSVFRALCNKPIREVASVPPMLDPAGKLTCRDITIFGLGGWLDAEVDDNQTLDWLAELLRTRPTAISELDPALLDYVVLVTTGN